MILLEVRTYRPSAARSISLNESQIFSHQARPNSVNKHFIKRPGCAFEFILTERTCIDQYAFLAEPYAFRPYYFKRTALIRNVFFMCFPNEIERGAALVIR